MDKMSPMPITPTLWQVEMLDMWTVSVPMLMPAMPVLVLMGMLVLLSTLVSDAEVVALGRIDIPDILIPDILIPDMLLLILIEPPSI